VAARPPSESSSPQSGQRFLALDAWRGISALVVALGHLSITGVLHDNPLFDHSYRFVDFFFVLSGFVIAHAYRARLAQSGVAEVGRFLVRRIGRLWPLHVVMLLAFVGFELCVLIAGHAGFEVGRPAFSEDNTLSAIPANLLLIQSWGVLDHGTWNNPSWSVSTELFAYGLFAALCALLPSRWLGPVAAVLLALAAALILAVAPAGMRSTYDFGLARCVLGFMVGVLVRAGYARWPLRLGTLGEVATIVAVLIAVAWLPVGPAEIAVTALFALAVWVFASESGGASRALRRPWPQRLGAWSYSIYMVHALIGMGALVLAMLVSALGFRHFARIDGVPTIVGSVPLTTAITLVYLAIIVAIARFTYRHVELRGQRAFAPWAAGLAAARPLSPAPVLEPE
jgi:peptidoglycan/LPS O-acetylase OafA/YrhL